MMANSSENYGISKLLNVFHSIMSEQAADIEAMSNHSQSPKISSDTFNELLHRQFFANFMDSEKSHPMDNDSLVNDVPKDLTTKRMIYQHEDPCNLITKGEMITYENVAFFLELVVQPTFICIGFVFNTIAINVLRR